MYLSAAIEAFSGASACNVTAKGADRHEIQIRGRFLPGWLGAFTAGLAEKKLNILSASACKDNRSAWEATFLVDSRLATGTVGAIDFLALAAGRLAAGRETIGLDSFHVEPTADGAILVEIRAADQLGFLTTMLKNFLLFSLFPSKLHIQTTGGRVHDRFWLRGVGGSIPSVETMQALRSEMQKLVAGNRPAFPTGFGMRPAIV